MSFEGAHAGTLVRERTRRAVGRMGDRIAAWAERQRETETLRGQVGIVRDALAGMIARLRGLADALPTDDTGFAAARAIDHDLAVVERMWRRFADGFAQRDAGAPYAALLRAADEVVWSCVAMVRPLAEAPPPLPLAYAEPAYTATATPRVRAPHLPVADRRLAAALSVLPVPLIGLPTAIADEPWWLALIAHEVGHHVQYDLEPRQALVTRTAALLAAHGGDADRERWAGWTYEVFADAFAVAALGPRALDVVAALEWNTAAAMGAPRGELYPPVAVRLALLAEVAGALGHGELSHRAAAWTGVDEATAALLARTPAVAAALVDAPLGKSTLRAVAMRGGGVAARAMARRLRGEDSGIEPGPDEPRRAVAAGFAAWLALPVEPDLEKPDTAARDLGARLIELVIELRDPTTVTRVTAPARETLTERLFEAMRAAEREGAP